MRHPVASSLADFQQNWYNSQPFGTPTSYGYHCGEDYNLKTGKDSDLGQPLYAVAKGKIVYYHNASHPTSGFGRHMVLECDTVRGKRWYMYSHCLEITTEVKDVNEGDIIGKLGKSGTTLAHLHFSVFKVNPSTLPNGIDTIAKTLTQLNDWWEKFEILGDTDMAYDWKGLDPTNLASMNIAVLTWSDVRDGKYITKEEHNKALEQISELSIKLQECQLNSVGTKIDSEVAIAGKVWEINGVTVDSNGVVVANYRIK